MRPSRIAELLEPFVARCFISQPADAAISPAPSHSEPATAGEEPAVLSLTQLQHISTYIDILLRWNARINLTAIRDPEEIVTRHFGESLFAARHLFPAAAKVGRPALDCPAEPSAAGALANHQRRMTNGGLSAADLGSGAGFPGIPVKLWAPHLALTLIESNHKKAAFLREVVRSLTLTDINVFSGRAEQLLHPERNQPGQSQSDRQPPLRAADQQSQGPASGRFHVVTLRAVERFASILPVAGSLVSPGGRLALLIGSSQLDQAQATLPTLNWDPPLPIPQSQSRILLIARVSVGPDRK
jgi:16S rRNA (guanine527-N7)-methyltransferase